MGDRLSRISRRSAILACAASLLAGCASTIPAAGPPLRAKTAPPVAALPPLDTVGLAAILNRSDQELVALFGPPRLDVREGNGRKLQFSGQSCVLDVYLYPPENGGEARSNYADARDLQGAAVDRGKCVERLKK